MAINICDKEGRQVSKLLSPQGAAVKVVAVTLPVKTQQQIALGLQLGKRAADKKGK